jgi:hypothetical protein
MEGQREDHGYDGERLTFKTNHDILIRGGLKRRSSLEKNEEAQQ